jgi:hypothetical protein
LAAIQEILNRVLEKPPNTVELVRAYGGLTTPSKLAIVNLKGDGESEARLCLWQAMICSFGLVGSRPTKSTDLAAGGVTDAADTPIDGPLARALSKVPDDNDWRAVAFGELGEWTKDRPQCPAAHRCRRGRH